MSGDRPEIGSNLSQREIDMLLASISEGDEDEESGGAPVQRPPVPTEIVRPYDFRHPDKFSRDQIRTVQTIHDTLGRLISNTIAAQTRTHVAIQFSSIDQMPFADYLQGLDSQTCIFAVPADPLPGHYVFELSLTIAMHILDRLQGGTGMRPRIPASGEVTDIERALLSGIGRWITGDIIQAWREIVTLNAHDGELHMEPHQVRQVLGSEVSLAIVYEIRIFEQIGQLSIAFPGSSLEPVMSRLSASMLFSATSPNLKSRNGSEWGGIAEPMGRVSLPVSVNLGRATLTMADVADLREGDVIVTDQDVHAALEMAVSGETLFEVRPGRIGGRMAAQVVGINLQNGQSA